MDRIIVAFLLEIHSNTLACNRTYGDWLNGEKNFTIAAAGRGKRPWRE